MNRRKLILGLSAFFWAVVLGTATAAVFQNRAVERTTKSYPDVEMDVLVDGRPLREYYERGRTYVEAVYGAEYELRLRNNSSDRVAVALAVDGLNTIDARHMSAWNASKWVIEPYQTITISGWQMSSARARRFYFTNERDSYGAKLGQTANLGVISAVFFRERRPITIIPPPPRPITRDDKMEAPQSSRSAEAGTGIGRDVRHDVRWTDMDLDPRSIGEITIRYEYNSRRFCPEP
jgi:hypothetical protein